MVLRAICLTVALALAPGALAQGWRAPPTEGAKLGLRAIACQGEFCLALSCRGGSGELVAMAAGGGPFNGATQATVGATRARLDFVEDPALMKAYNMLGTRAKASPELLAAMTSAKEIALSGPTFSDRATRRFALKGYAALAAKSAAACGPGE